MARRRRRRLRLRNAARWGQWHRLGEHDGVYYSERKYGFEVPLAGVVMPNELWATIVLHGLEKSYRQMLGAPPESGGDHIDIGALVVAIHDVCDVEQICAAGMSADARSGLLNQATRWLVEELGELPRDPTPEDFALLGRRISEHAEWLDLTEVFAS